MKNIIKWIIAICGCLVFVLCISTIAHAAEYNIATNDSWVSGRAEAGEANFYKFSLPSAGLITVTCQCTENSVKCELMDSDRVKTYSHCAVGGSATNPGTQRFDVNLEAGEYSLKLKGYKDLYYWERDTTYRVKISFTPANNNEKEPNNTFNAAMSLSSGQMVKGFFSQDDAVDFYRFSVDKTMTVKVTVNTAIDLGLPYYSLSIWNSEFMQLEADDTSSSGSTYVWEKSVSPGIYYIRMINTQPYYGETTGAYTLKWQGFNYVTSIKLKKSSMVLAKGKTYSLLNSVLPSTATNKKLNWRSDNKSVVTVNSSGKVTAKNVGAATITVAAQDGSRVSASCRVVVKPAKAVIKSCKRVADRNVIVKVQKQKNISGIQYQLSRKKNFKGKKSSYYVGSTETTATTDTLSKKKTYYFRVRMYIDYGGKRYYGEWSTVKKIKTKGKTYKYGYYAWKNI